MLGLFVVLVTSLGLVGGITAPVATAAPGDPASLYLTPSTAGAIVGSQKTGVAPTECPSNMVASGFQTENRQNVAVLSANSILTQFHVQCSSVTTNNAGQVLGTVSPTLVRSAVYDQGRGNLTLTSCPANQFVHKITGTTFVGDVGSRWPSSVTFTCRPLTLQPDGTIRINLASPATVLTSGTNFNTTGGLNTPANICGPDGTTGVSDILVRGYRAQNGGEGIDGFNPSCATIADDFGDAPATYGVASHELNAATYLGWSADGESAMQHSATASGDDAVGGTAPNQSIDDENGAATFGPLIANSDNSYSVQVLASNKAGASAAVLAGWIDFNRNGTFEANEGATIAVPAGTADGSSFPLSWNNIAGQTVSGASFARIRIANGTGLTISTPTGTAITGEVEDYPVTIQAAVPTLTIAKAATPTVITASGQNVVYGFTVTNTGNVPLTSITVNETMFSGTGPLPAPVCVASSLAPTASTTCSLTYTATQADVDAGTISNTATATGTLPRGGTIDSAPASAVVTATLAPAIVVVKSADLTEMTAVGQIANYSFLVTNTGNTTLTDVTVTETAFTGTGTAPVITCPPGAASLAPAASVTCTASYALTAADVDTGSVTNTATATGSPPGATTPPVSPPSTVTIPVSLAPFTVLIEKLGESSDAVWVPMDGSAWAVHDDDSGTLGALLPDQPVAAVADATGRFEIADIPAGTYWLVETSAPAGFSLLAEPVQFTVSSSGVVDLGSGTGGGVVTVADVDDDGIFLITVRDVPAMQLPESGGSGSAPYLAGGVVLLAAAAAMVAVTKRRGKRAGHRLL